MELDILKHFIKHEVEVLVGGVWIEGLMMPIVKGVVVLMPVGEMQAFFGPASLKAESIQAIRQIKKHGVIEKPIIPTEVPAVGIRSSLESVTPGQRFNPR
jgi:hypothetical protein